MISDCHESKVNSGPSPLSAKKKKSDTRSNRSSARCYAPAEVNNQLRIILSRSGSHSKYPLATTRYSHVHPFRALPLHRRHARPTLHRRRALNGRHSARHRLWLRRPARTHGPLHRSFRRIHRQRPQTSPRGAKQVPHKRRRATRQTLPPLNGFCIFKERRS